MAVTRRSLSQRRRGGRQNQIDRCEAPRCDRVVVTNVGVCHYLQVAHPVQTIAMRRMTAMVALRTTNLGIAMVGQAAIRREREKQGPFLSLWSPRKGKKKGKEQRAAVFWETKKHIRHSPTTPLFTIPISLRKRLDRKKRKQGLFLKGHTFLSIFHLFPTLLYIFFFS